jgi:hypothetical protein
VVGERWILTMGRILLMEGCEEAGDDGSNFRLARELGKYR